MSLTQPGSHSRPLYLKFGQVPQVRLQTGCLIVCLLIHSHCSDQTNGLIGNANKEDLRILFDGLDSLPVGFSNNIPSNLPNAPSAINSVPNAQDLDGPGTFTMHQLHTAVNDLYKCRLPHQHSHPAQPFVPINYPPPIVPGQALYPNGPLA